MISKSTTSMFTVLFVSILGLGGLTACSSGEKDSDKLYEAQACLDTATKTTVSDCLTKIDGLESKQAYLLRCASVFIQDGFDDPSRFASAFSQLDKKTGTTDPTLGLLGYMAFSSSTVVAENQAHAQLAMDYCQKSESAGYIMLASMANIATTITSLSTAITTIDPNNPPSAEEMSAALAEILTNPNAQTSIGATAITAYQSNCSGDSATGNASLCSDLSQALASSSNPTDPTAVGAALMTIYQTGSK